MKIFLNYIVSFGIVATVVFSAQAQRAFIPADEQQLAQIDSNTLKWRNKLYPVVSQGDLNIYGFEETDVPIYADSVYAYRLALLESEIPLEYNQYVRPYIDLYTMRRRKLASKVLAWSQYYFPQFEQALDREKMPMELKYLAVIESALNPAATSPVGAAGMWQFMAPTGRMYGLKTSAHYDERRDVTKSTDAAIKYLRNSYRIYGDWLLVIASYNCGPGNVNKAIRRAGGVKNFWVIQQYLPRETRGYVPAFVAAAYMMNYASEHNIYPSTDLNVYRHMDTVLVDNSYSLNQLALRLNIPLEELKEYNPALRRGIIPFSNEKIALTLPYNKAIAFTNANSDTGFKMAMNKEVIALNKQIQHEKQGVKGTIQYKVRRGDHLAAIASKYDVTVKEIKKWNHLKSNKVKAGQRLKIKSNQG
ncbi:MAG: transglycosylase SLT domain-containing protein [Bacteroidota bacterium]